MNSLKRKTNSVTISRGVNNYILTLTNPKPIHTHSSLPMHIYTYQYLPISTPGFIMKNIINLMKRRNLFLTEMRYRGPSTSCLSPRCHVTVACGFALIAHPNLIEFPSPILLCLRRDVNWGVWPPWSMLVSFSNLTSDMDGSRESREMVYSTLSRRCDVVISGSVLSYSWRARSLSLCCSARCLCSEARQSRSRSTNSDSTTRRIEVLESGCSDTPWSVAFICRRIRSASSYSISTSEEQQQKQFFNLFRFLKKISS